MSLKQNSKKSSMCEYIFKKGAKKGMKCEKKVCSKHVSKECGICYENVNKWESCKKCNFNCCKDCYQKINNVSCPQCRDGEFKEVTGVEEEVSPITFLLTTRFEGEYGRSSINTPSGSFEILIRRL